MTIRYDPQGVEGQTLPLMEDGCSVSRMSLERTTKEGESPVDENTN